MNSYNSNNIKPPALINLPPFIKYLTLSMIVIHVIRLALPYAGLESVAYFIDIFGPVSPRVAAGLGAWAWLSVPVSLITFQFLHSGWLHLLMNSFFMAAIGTGVEYRLGGKKMILFFLACGVIAGCSELVLSVVTGSYDKAVVGASGGISGFFAAVLWLQSRQKMPWNPKKQMLKFSLIFSVVLVVIGVAFPGENVAWVAHVGGFWAGVFLFPYFEKPWDRPKKDPKPKFTIVQ